MGDGQPGDAIAVREPRRGKGCAINKPCRFGVTHPHNKPHVAESIAAPLQQCTCPQPHWH